MSPSAAHAALLRRRLPLLAASCSLCSTSAARSSTRVSRRWSAASRRRAGQRRSSGAWRRAGELTHTGTGRSNDVTRGGRGSWMRRRNQFRKPKTKIDGERTQRRSVSERNSRLQQPTAARQVKPKTQK